MARIGKVYVQNKYAGAIKETDDGYEYSYDESYLSEIKFICLAMTDEYIENNYNLIVSHSSDIEHRGDDVDCTTESLKEDNRMIMEGYQRVGEQMTLIDIDYKESIDKLIDKF